MTLSKFLDPSDLSFLVAFYTYMACVLPFALPGFTRMSRDLWWNGDIAARVAAVAGAGAMAVVCACFAALAMAGEFQRIRGLAPDAFQFGVLAGWITNAIIGGVEIMRQFGDKPHDGTAGRTSAN